MVKRKLPDDLREKLIQSGRLTGATGHFPDGRPLDEYDEGECHVGICSQHNEVLLDLGRKASRIALDPDDAIKLAQMLIETAYQIKHERPERVM